jgi:hypothetical protein
MRQSAKQKQKSPALGVQRGAAARLTRSLSRIFPSKSFFPTARSPRGHFRNGGHFWEAQHLKSYFQSRAQKGNALPDLPAT